jgi:hypothetical protein
MGVVGDNAHDPESQKVFAPLFSKSGRFLFEAGEAVERPIYRKP